MAYLDTKGTATSPAGFRAGATYSGVKTYGDDPLDVGILVSDAPCTAAGLFTKNRLRSAPVDVNIDKLAAGVARGVVVNSGVANSSTGERGIADALQMAAWAANRAGVDEGEMLVCSTGVIGHFLPMEKIRAGIEAVALARAGGGLFARAIMTTDTRPKHAAVRVGPYTLGGCVKGAGMVHPNMATMLAFLTTDAPMDAGFLRRELRLAADRSFNLVSVDGDTSPSDSVLLFANGAAGGEAIDDASAIAGEVREALNDLSAHLAKEIARDAEGATRLMTITVRGAASDDDARKLVRAISTSYLVKTAVHGADPNWGRIVGVIGRTEVAYEEAGVAVAICGTQVFEGLRPTAFDEADLSARMRGKDVTIDVDLGAGDDEATGWGCDLSAEYVSINADYTT